MPTREGLTIPPAWPWMAFCSHPSRVLGPKIPPSGLPGHHHGCRSSARSRVRSQRIILPAPSNALVFSLMSFPIPFFVGISPLQTGCLAHRYPRRPFPNPVADFVRAPSSCEVHSLNCVKPPAVSRADVSRPLVQVSSCRSAPETGLALLCGAFVQDTTFVPLPSIIPLQRAEYPISDGHGETEKWQLRRCRRGKVSLRSRRLHVGSESADSPLIHVFPTRLSPSLPFNMASSR